MNNKIDITKKLKNAEGKRLLEKNALEYSKEIIVALEELDECIADNQTVEQAYERKQIALVFNQFLGTLSETERQMFLCRYWFLDSITDIANYFGYSTSKVTSMLHRSRKKLRLVLEKEGII